jgi:hypothetical protein
MEVNAWAGINLIQFSQKTIIDNYDAGYTFAFE